MALANIEFSKLFHSEKVECQYFLGRCDALFARVRKLTWGRACGDLDKFTSLGGANNLFAYPNRSEGNGLPPPPITIWNTTRKNLIYILKDTKKLASRQGRLNQIGYCLAVASKQKKLMKDPDI